MNKSQSFKRVTGKIPLELDDRIEEFSEEMGLTKEQFISQALIVQLQILQEKEDALRLIHQLGDRLGINPDFLLVEAVRSYVLDLADGSCSLADLSASLLSESKVGADLDQVND